MALPCFALNVYPLLTFSRSCRWVAVRERSEGDLGAMPAAELVSRWQREINAALAR